MKLWVTMDNSPRAERSNIQFWLTKPRWIPQRDDGAESEGAGEYKYGLYVGDIAPIAISPFNLVPGDIRHVEIKEER